VTIYLDATALVGYLLDEPARVPVERLLRDGGTAINAINYGEALDAVSRRRRLEASTVERVVTRLVGRGLELDAVSPRLAAQGAGIRARHYHGRHRPISLADCIAVAAARGETLATADRDQAAVAREEGVGVIELPPSAAG